MKSLHLSLSSRGLALLALALCSCDPAGPGASGTINMGDSVKPQDYSTLEIRVYADDSETFAAARIPELPTAQLSMSTTEVTFPYAYDVGEAVGTSAQKRWRMTSWLSKEAAGSERPAAADPFCSVAFDLEECGALIDGYCDAADGIDCTIE